MKQTLFQSVLLVLFASMATLPNSSAQGQWIDPIQEEEWSRWQPVQPDGGWSPWQPVPGPVIPTPVQPDGGWSPWQPVQPPSPWQPQPSPWQPQPSPWQPQPTPNGPFNPTGNSFVMTVVNRMNGPINFQMGGQSQTIQSQQSAQFNTVEGTEYTYSGPSYEAQPGRWVGGGVYRGVVSARERTIVVGGQDGPGPDPVNPGGNAFLVTVVNRMDGPITFQTGNQTQTIGSQQSWQFNAIAGTEYGYSGPSRQVQPGVWVGGGTYRGVVSENERTITVGGQPNPNPNPNPNPGNLFSVTFINTYSGEVTITIYDQNRNQVSSSRIPAGQSVAFGVKDGYTYVQGGPVVYSNGGASSGTRQGQISASNPEIQLRD